MSNIQQVKSMDENTLKGMLNSSKPFLLLDLRTPLEFSNGHIIKSRNIPIEVFKDSIIHMNIPIESTIVLYCRTGRKSGIACNILDELGFKNIFNFGGIYNWNYGLEK